MPASFGGEARRSGLEPYAGSNGESFQLVDARDLSRQLTPRLGLLVKSAVRLSPQRHRGEQACPTLAPR